jgi:hypothetical protein
MPQSRKYENRAAQQAAYRKRQTISHQQMLSQKGLPPLPPLPTIPGEARWRAMMGYAQTLLSQTAEEMQSYHDERSEPWQDSAKAEEMLARIEHLQEALAQLQDAE